MFHQNPVRKQSFDRLRQNFRVLRRYQYPGDSVPERFGNASDVSTYNGFPHRLRFDHNLAEPFLVPRKETEYVHRGYELFDVFPIPGKNNPVRNTEFMCHFLKVFEYLAVAYYQITVFREPAFQHRGGFYKVP